MLVFVPGRGVGEMLFGKGGGDGAEFVVERLAVGGDEWRAEEAIDGDLLAAAFFERAAADFPAVEIEGCQPVAEYRGSNGIETAGDGLDEKTAAGAMCPFDGAETAGVFKTGVRAFLAAVQQRRHEVAIGIHFEKPRLFYLLPAGRTHPSAVLGIVSFKQFRFGFQQGSTAVANDAASAAADVVIAAEILRKHLRRDQNIPDLDDGR